MSEPIFVPIGNSCSIAYQLQKNNLRQFAFPFDWTRVKKLSTITKIINSKFEGYCDFIQINNVTSYPLLNNEEFDDTADASKETTRAKNKYNVFSFHDFSSKMPFDEQLNEVKEKYWRRINRFYNCLGVTNRKIIFVRDELEPDKLKEEDILNFINCITNINKDLDFEIRIICHKPKKNQINLKNVKMILDLNEFANWMRPNVDWSQVFSK